MKLHKNIAFFFLSLIITWLGLNLMHSFEVEHQHHKDDISSLVWEDGDHEHNDICDDHHQPLLLTIHQLFYPKSHCLKTAQAEVNPLSIPQKETLSIKGRAPPVLM